MIGILIATHADFGQGIINAIKLITGTHENVKTIGLNHGDGITAFEEKVFYYLEEMDQGDGVMGLCDFLGGSPSNAMLRCMKMKNFPCIAGVNMPMVLEAVMNRGNTDVWELAEKCRTAGISGIVSLNAVAQKMMVKEESSADF